MRVDATQFEGWFYEGAGIYRHVWLAKTGPLAVAPDGIFVYSQFAGHAPEGPAELHVETRLDNARMLRRTPRCNARSSMPGNGPVAAAQPAQRLDPRTEAELKSMHQCSVPSGRPSRRALQSGHDR